MPPGRPNTHTSSYFDDDELAVAYTHTGLYGGVGAATTTPFGGGLGIQLGVGMDWDSVKHLSKDVVVVQMKQSSKELRKLYKASFSEYKSHTDLYAHEHFDFVTTARKKAVKESKHIRVGVMKAMGIKSWKKASPEQKKEINAAWHQREKDGGTVDIHGLEQKAAEIKRLWEAGPHPHVEHHPAPVGAQNRHHFTLHPNAAGHFKILDVLHWCRQATSMLMSIATRHNNPGDNLLVKNVERARELRSYMYQLRMRMKAINGKFAAGG
jgi:hypothetical protein